MIIAGQYVDLAATAVNVFASTWAGVALYLGMWQVPRWRKAAENRRVLRGLARLDDFGRPVTS